MFKEFSEEFPKMKPLQEEVYNKIHFFSGATNINQLEMLAQLGVEDVSVNFFHFRQRDLQTVKECLKQFKHVLITPGDENFYDAKALEIPSHDEIRYYATSYLNFCQALMEHTTFVLEFRTALEIGIKYRQAAIEEMDARGIRVIQVFDEFMLRDPEEYGVYDRDFISFGKELVKDIEKAKKLAKKFEEKGILIHASYCTDQAQVNQVPYFSAELSAWISAAKFGVFYTFENNILKAYPKAAMKEAIEINKAKYMAFGLDYQKILQQDSQELIKANTAIWKEYIDYHKYNVANSFWLSPREKARGKDMFIGESGLPMVADSEERFVRAHRDAEKFRSQELTALVPASMNKYIDPRVAMPLMCINCTIQEKCPAFKEDEMCYFSNVVNIEEAGDLLGVLSALQSMQYNRISHAAMVEKLQGGNLDSSIGREVDTVLKIAETMTKLYEIVKNQKPKESVLSTLFNEEEEADQTGPGADKYL